jgi:tetratricopeptide (TPR) repeat protein
MEFKSGPIKLSVGPKPRDPAADLATLQAIEAALEAEDYAAAMARAEAALADGLQHPMVLNLAAERLEAEERFADALGLLQRGHQMAPDDLGLRQSLGLCLFRLRQFQTALPHFEALIAAEPDFAPAHAALGATLEALGDDARAETAYNRAWALQPENLLAIGGLASIASRGGRHAEARALAERVLQSEPGYPEAVIAIVRADLAEGRRAQAEASVAALVADPRVSDEQRAMARALLADPSDA